MKRTYLLLSFLTAFLLLFAFPANLFAIENPLSFPNNKFGIHLLFTDEIDQAARLINSSGGDYGYVTVPIQAGDRNLLKWQRFMDKTRKLHVIPIIRISTEGDYFNKKAWRTPAFDDVLDFANFLSSLDWPTKNRYVVVFNEVNRADEWGKDPDPYTYADLLNYAVAVFKSKSPDFFMLPAGLDNAAATVSGASMNEYEFLQKMNQKIPGIFGLIDGFASHSYPNPAFAQPPSVVNAQSIGSFLYERSLVENLADKKLPIFITETGWSRSVVSDEKQAEYYKKAFATVWNNDAIVAITPFLLQASLGPFTVFSFLEYGQPSKQYKELFSLPKVKGAPRLSNTPAAVPFPVNIFEKQKDYTQANVLGISTIAIPKNVTLILKWLLKM